MAITVVTPATDTNLTTAATVAAALGLGSSADTVLLSRLIAVASQQIDRYCNQVFAQRTITETLPGSGNRLLRLRYYPLVTLGAITYDGATVDSSLYSVDDAPAGTIYNANGWLYSDENRLYGVTYTHGYITNGASRNLPFDLEQAAIRLVATMYLSSKRDPGIKQESVPEAYSVTYGDGALTSGIPGEVKGILDLYKRRRM